MNVTFKHEMREAEGIEIISLVDNSIDLLSTIELSGVWSFRQWSKARFEFPKAEHGFAMLIRILCHNRSSTILFDTGCSSDGVIENCKRLGLKLDEVEHRFVSWTL